MKLWNVQIVLVFCSWVWSLCSSGFGGDEIRVQTHQDRPSSDRIQYHRWATAAGTVNQTKPSECVFEEPVVSLLMSISQTVESFVSACDMSKTLDQLVWGFRLNWCFHTTDEHMTLASTCFHSVLSHASLNQVWVCLQCKYSASVTFFAGTIFYTSFFFCFPKGHFYC